MYKEYDHTENIYTFQTIRRSNILCFRYINCNNPNLFNSQLRQCLIMDGDFYIVQTVLNEKTYLRVTLLNPKTTVIHIKNLINSISKIAKKLKSEG